jgi:hypothetical protein
MLEFVTGVLKFRGWTELAQRVKMQAQIKLFSYKNDRYDENDFFVILF